MGTAVIFAVAVILLALIARGRSRFAAIEEPLLPEEAGQQFIVRLPPTALLASCISVDDAIYVSSLRMPSLSRLLLRERRRLALLWLRQTRREAGRLYRLHRRTSGRAEDLEPVAEIQLLFHFAAFLFVYQILISVVWFYGPVRTQVFVGSIRALAAVLATHAERIAGAITSSQASEIRAGRSA